MHAHAHTHTPHTHTHTHMNTHTHNSELPFSINFVKTFGVVVYADAKDRIKYLRLHSLQFIQL